MGREEHTRLLGTDQYLHNHSDVYDRIVKSLFGTVVDSPRPVEGCPAHLDRLNEGVCTLNVQVGILLAGKTGVRKVFCRCTGTDGNHYIISHLHV
ncbi:hypothetical protein MKMG_02176 [Methanogenium sp. MK-MG]|nr:hypothetical protein MKMG_02176 [Methanogenium sp. MK-MG]